VGEKSDGNDEGAKEEFFGCGASNVVPPPTPATKALDQCSATDPFPPFAVYNTLLEKRSGKQKGSEKQRFTNIED